MPEAELFFLNQDVLLHVVEGGWLASNPRLRTHVGLDAAALSVLVAAGVEGKDEAAWLTMLDGVMGHDRTQREIGAQGLHADHSGVSAQAGQSMSGMALFTLLRQRRVLIADEAEALDLVRPLSSPLDRDGLGSFHQRVGQHLLLQRQRDPWRAWQNQKFSEDGMQLREGVYQQLQAPFFEAYFTPQRLQAKRVLDFGCGNAYFSARMAAAGAQVLALDNSPELMAMARRNYGGVTGLSLLETPDFDAVLACCAAEAAGSFDFITLQDTLLLLLQPENGPASAQQPEVFRAFRRLLKADGRLCAMEPNAVFWLASRYGYRHRPYAVLSEYFEPLFHVAPNLEMVMAFMARVGFVLAGYQHPRPLETVADADLAWQRQFPTWDFFEFLPRAAA